MSSFPWRGVATLERNEGAEWARQRALADLERPLTERRFALPPCKCSGPVTTHYAQTPVAVAAARSFSELCPLIRNANVFLSFWGSRYIRVQGRVESLTIDALAQRVLELVKQNPDFDQKERSHGKTIARLINQLYDASDKQVLESSWFTRLFVFLRNIPNLLAGFQLLGVSRTCSQTRWDWKECEITNLTSFMQEPYCKIFNCYTKPQYEAIFGPVRAGQILGGKGPDSIYWSPEDNPRQWTLDQLRFQIQRGYLIRGQIIEISAACGFADILKDALEGRINGWIGGDNCGKAIKYAAQNNHSECLRLVLQNHSDMIDLDKLVEAANLAEFHGDMASVQLLKQVIRSHSGLPSYLRQSS